MFSISKEEFCKCWISTKDEGEDKGVALLFETTPDFYNIDDESKLDKTKFSFLFQYLSLCHNLT